MTHLQEAEAVQELPDVVDGLRSGDEHISGRGVHDEVQISLPVTCLHIHDTLSSRKLMQTRRQELNLGDSQRKLARLGPGRDTRYSDNVASSDDIVALQEHLEGLGRAVRQSRNHSRQSTHVAEAMTCTFCPSARTS